LSSSSSSSSSLLFVSTTPPLCFFTGVFSPKHRQKKNFYERNFTPSQEEEHRKQTHNKYRREKTTDKAIKAFIYTRKRERERENNQSINQSNKH
jgi:hypothetical protein